MIVQAQDMTGFEIKIGPMSPENNIDFPASLVIVDDNYNIKNEWTVASQESIAKLLYTTPGVKADISNAYISYDDEKFWKIKYEKGRDYAYFDIDRSNSLVVGGSKKLAQDINAIYNDMINKTQALAIAGENMLKQDPSNQLALLVLETVDAIDAVHAWVSEGKPLPSQMQEVDPIQQTGSAIIDRLSFVINSIA